MLYTCDILPSLSTNVLFVRKRAEKSRICKLKDPKKHVLCSAVHASVIDKQDGFPQKSWSEICPGARKIESIGRHRRNETDILTAQFTPT